MAAAWVVLLRLEAAESLRWTMRSGQMPRRRVAAAVRKRAIAAGVRTAMAKGTPVAVESGAAVAPEMEGAVAAEMLVTRADCSLAGPWRLE